MFLTLKAVSNGGITTVIITEDNVPFSDLQHPVYFMQCVLDTELLIPIYTEINVDDIPTVKKWLRNTFKED